MASFEINEFCQEPIRVTSEEQKKGFPLKKKNAASSWKTACCKGVKNEWRTGRDSNPRYPHGYTPLAGERFRPLSHRSFRRGEEITMDGSRQLSLTLFCVLSVDFSSREGKKGFLGALFLLLQWKKAGEKVFQRGFSSRLGGVPAFTLGLSS